MARVTINFAKRGLAVFVSHIDLPIIFARAARRAGLVPELTQGYTPRARLALGPPLPVGVAAEAEPAEFWFDDWSDELFSRWRSKMPEGLEIISWHPSSGVSLSKLCTAASYLITPKREASADDVASCVASRLEAEGALLSSRVVEGSAAICSSELERLGPSKMINFLTEAALISGWQDVSMIRTAVGSWDGASGEVIPLTGAF